MYICIFVSVVVSATTQQTSGSEQCTVDKQEIEIAARLTDAVLSPTYLERFVYTNLVLCIFDIVYYSNMILEGDEGNDAPPPLVVETLLDLSNIRSFRLLHLEITGERLPA